MRDVVIAGAGMTRFGRWPDRGLKDLGREAVVAALDQAGMPLGDLEVAVVGNAAAGILTGQEQVRGQVILRDLGLHSIPIINTENACASSSTACHLAWVYVASGLADTALVLGIEKMSHPDKTMAFRALSTAVDVEDRAHLLAEASLGEGAAAGAGTTRSIFMDLYAARIRRYMDRHGATAADFARVAVKSHANAGRNPYAHYQQPYTMEEVLASPEVVFPLTRLMCAPISDGAAALVLCAGSRVRQYTSHATRVAASVLVSGRDRSDESEPSPTRRAATQAYERAGLGPEALQVVELHDATAASEVFHGEDLGLWGPGEGVRMLDEGVTALTGRVPINPSGGLLSRGHPIGATGTAQLAELFWQLQGWCGDRQVQEGRARTALAHNGGGNVRGEAAALAIHILER